MRSRAYRTGCQEKYELLHYLKHGNSGVSFIFMNIPYRGRWSEENAAACKICVLAQTCQAFQLEEGSNSIFLLKVW